ncbi:hypothetical protein ACHAXT_013029 [Thalassiosira profunda]
MPLGALPRVILLLLAWAARCTSDAYTYEPPGRDPVSIDNVRASEKAVRLTTDNFDELTNGKLVFIKFYAPYCPHCKEVAPDWNKLATHYQELPDSDDILIGSIDCTDSPKGKGLCARFKIMGLPTFLYGDASHGGVHLQEYPMGDKTYEQFKSFAAKALVPTCLPGSLDACAPDERPQMEFFMDMSYDALEALIKATEKEEEDANTAYKTTFAKLQKEYDQGLTEKELAITKANANKKLIREVMALKEQ